jgi:hypothetical protein
VFEYLRFRWRLSRLEKEERRLDKEYDAKIKAAKERQATDEEIDNLDMESGHVSFHFEEEIQKLHSGYLLRQAYRLIIPTPQYGKNEMWDMNEAHDSYLSKLGIAKLRADIRAERKARIELFLMWMPGVVGILGALIGLAAVLVGKR